MSVCNGTATLSISSGVADTYASVKGEVWQVWADLATADVCVGQIMLNANTEVMVDGTTDYFGREVTVSSAGNVWNVEAIGNKPLGRRVLLAIQAKVNGLVGIHDAPAAATLTAPAGFTGYAVRKGTIFCEWFENATPAAGSATLTLGSNNKLWSASMTDFYGNPVKVDAATNTVSHSTGSPLGKRVLICAQAIADGVILAP